MSIDSIRSIRARKPLVLIATTVALVGISAVTARAQQSPISLDRLGVSGVYSYLHANAGNTTGWYNLNGGTASLTYRLSDRLLAVGEFGAYRFGALPNQIDSMMYTYLFGPRLAIPNIRRLHPFAQALFGGGRLNAGSSGINAGENAFAMAAGGGLDVPLLHSHFSIRAAEVEYLRTQFAHTGGSSGRQNYLRISAGVTYRFGGKQ